MLKFSRGQIGVFSFYGIRRFYFVRYVVSSKWMDGPRTVPPFLMFSTQKWKRLLLPYLWNVILRYYRYFAPGKKKLETIGRTAVRKNLHVEFFGTRDLMNP